MRKSNLYEQNRQSPWAVVLILLRYIRLLVRQLWPLLLVLLLNRGDRLQFWLGIITIGAASFTLIGSLLEFFRFYYWVDGEKLYIEKGLIRKTSINIPFDRIQTIDFEQNPVHQFLNVVRVNIDSAGSKSEEISFDALTLDDARDLRDFILEHKDEEDEVTIDESGAIVRPDDELILQLSPKDLLKIGISQNHLRTAGIIFAAMWAFADNIGQALNIDMYEELGNRVGEIAAGSLVLLLIAVPFFLIVSFLVTLVRTVINYYDLKFTKNRRGFKLIGGLFTKKEKSAPKDKIQIIAWSTNPIRKLFGIFHLRLYQASSVEVIGGKSFVVPGCYQEHIDKTINSVIPEASGADFEIHSIDPLAKRRFIVFAGLLPCVAASIIAYVFGKYHLFWFWLYFPFAIYMAQLYYLKRKFQLTEEACISSSGIFGRKYKIMQLYKVQSVRIVQSFYQLRHGLATIVLYTAAGDVRFPFIPVEKANQLRDYLIYKIESSRRDWM